MGATASKPKSDPRTFGGTIDIPARCKPSKALSRHPDRPILMHAFLRRRDGDLWLLATDSFIAVGIKVRDTGAQEGWIPAGALKYMERGKDGEQISETSWRVQTEPCATTTFDIGEVVTGSKEFPDLEAVGLWDPGAKSLWDGGRVEVGINPAFMARIGESFDARDSNGCRFDIPGPLKPIHVTPLRSDIEAVALQMPIHLVV